MGETSAVTFALVEPLRDSTTGGNPPHALAALGAKVDLLILREAVPLQEFAREFPSAVTRGKTPEDLVLVRDVDRVRAAVAGVVSFGLFLPTVRRLVRIDHEVAPRPSCSVRPRPSTRR